MADRIELQFRRAVGSTIPGGAPVLVAVSGGGDSVALLHLLRRLRRSSRSHLTVAHLDHGLRRGSRADRRFVENLASSLSLDCIADRRAVETARRRDESPEEAARRVRRAFLLEAARITGSECIATGHTLDDQAETVLMRLVRGAGATALTGMADRGPGPFVRPLLGFERVELRVWLERHGIEFLEDPSNRDLRFDRNRIRLLVLPLLAEKLNPRAARHLVQAAGRFREDAVFLDEMAQKLAKRLCQEDGKGRLFIDVDGLGQAPPILGRRVVRVALERAGVDPRRLGARHIDDVLGLVPAPGRNEIHLPGRKTARKTRGRIVILDRRKPAGP